MGTRVYYKGHHGSAKNVIEAASQDEARWGKTRCAALKHVAENFDAMPYSMNEREGSRCYVFGALPQTQSQVDFGHTPMPFQFKVINGEAIEWVYPDASLDDRGMAYVVPARFA